MSVRQLGRAFASKLHATQLKPLGFKKLGATFLCERDDYVEMYNIQGSGGNSFHEPWRFYLNVYVRFSDVGPQPFQKETPTYHHAHCRAESIVTEAPPWFNLTSDNLDIMVQDVAAIICSVSQQLPGLIEQPRKRALKGLDSVLPLPPSWEVA